MSATSPKSAIHDPARLDHAVLAISDLATARARFSALGFTVAADAQHPFGTENCCVYLADGFFLEPLAVGQRETCEETAIKGNVFTARDQSFRFRNFSGGFSGLSLASRNAAADHARFSALGFSGGKPLSFSRIFADSQGNKAKAAFKLAFSADLRSPDAFIFSCERIGTTPDRGALTKHRNGVIGLSAVLAAESNPSDFQYYLQGITGQREVHSDSLGMSLALPNGRIEVRNEVGLAMMYGLPLPTAERGLRFVGMVLKVRNLARMREILQQAAVVFREMHSRLIVEPAPGQGTTIIFEERK
jgi:hypothetical protein